MSTCVSPYVHISFRSSTIPVLQCPTHKGYYHYSDTGVCLKVYTQDKTQQDAQLSCQMEGGHLFDINIEEEFNSLKDYFINVISKHPSQSFSTCAEDPTYPRTAHIHPTELYVCNDL